MTRATPRPTRIHLTCPHKERYAQLVEAAHDVGYDLTYWPKRAQAFIFAGTQKDLAAFETWEQQTATNNLQRIAFLNGPSQRLNMLLSRTGNLTLHQVASSHINDFSARILGHFFLKDQLTPLASRFIGQSLALRRCLDQLRASAEHRLPLLIHGESGCGKELCAQFLHKQRNIGKLMTVNCASLSPQLVESELFGHHKGAFTGAESERVGILSQTKDGTCFLDEIGELPLQAQASLLRAVEYDEIRPVGANQPHPFQGRLVLATNRNLAEKSKNGTFRFDLYQRLLTLSVTLPPLRQRKEDIPLLMHHFLQELNQEHNYAMAMPEDLSDCFRYDWPGNVRELRNTITRAYIMNERRGTRLIINLDPQLKEQDEHSARPQHQNETGTESETETEENPNTVQIPYHVHKDTWPLLQNRALETMLTTLTEREGGVTQNVINKTGLSRSQLYRKLKTLKEP